MESSNNNTSSANGYGDPPYSATTISDKDSYQESSSGNGLKATARYDGLGRTWRKAAYEGSNNWAISDTEFDALGRVKRVSNPYRASSLTGAVNPPGEWSTTDYDALSRVVKLTTPDTAHVDTAYYGNQVVVTDQALKKRMSETDALGRLSKVWEIRPADAATVAVSFPGQSFTAGYLTTYGYDALDDLLTVNQGVQSRSFNYDSLKRLASATNPESGTTNYTYDPNGNLLTKTDARTAKTSFVYDALNRVQTKTYTGTTTEGINAANATPAVSYLYDSQAFLSGAPAGFNRGLATGRLVAVNYSGGSQGDYLGYDELGRVVRKTQQIGTVNYPVTATYNRASAMLSETYPSNRSVSYAYDTAGRASNVTGTLGDGASRNYATGLQCNAAGQMTQEQFGTATALTHRLSYNNRQQLYNIRLGTDVGAYGAENRGRLTLFYNNAEAFGDSGVNNNGNLYRTDHVAPLDDNVGSWLDSVSYYSYDELNRLASVDELPVASWVGNGNLGWLPQAYAQRYQYDRYGNRTLNPLATWGIGINRKAFAIDAANNNRLTVPSGQTGVMSYDAAGNLTRDTWTGSGFARLSYDAENRVKTATDDNNTVTYGSYTYDGEGKRVKRVSNGVETWQVYGIGGELVAEYPANGAAGSPQKEYGYRNGQLLIVAQSSPFELRWEVADHLGTPRMSVRGTGVDGGSLASVTRHDYLPFGEELPAGMGVRATSSGYAADNVRMKYVGKERDGETGLDFAQARYYSSVQGTFTKPDVFGGRLKDPHKYVDLDGKSLLLRAFIGAAGGAAVGAGLEAAKALDREESLTDTKVLQRKGINRQRINLL